MIDRKNKLSIKRQAGLLGMSRASVYHKPKLTLDSDLKIMRRMDELHLEHPWMGSRKLRDMLNREGILIGRKHVRTLMRKMGLEAIYRKPNTSKPNPAHKAYPYLLRKLEVSKSNHVWAMDICYIPMKKGFVYLCAVMDWASRKVLSHRISISLDADFCIEAVEEAMGKYGKPEIFNTDQGSQFTSQDFTQLLKDSGVKISMDGKGAWRDNVFVERLWRSVKYEEVYLRAYDSVSEAKIRIHKYFDFYNTERSHSSLDKMTPNEYYFSNQPQPLAEAA